MRDLDFLRIVYDEEDDCPYLPDQRARMPLAVSPNGVDPAAMDQLLENGYRRTGAFFYRTECPHCQACEALRLNVDRFQPSRSQRRVMKRGDQALRTVIGSPSVDKQRVELFNKHRVQRSLNHGDAQVDAGGYQGFLLNAPCPSAEMTFWLSDTLVAVAIVDMGQKSLSAVYTYFDPQASRYSPGTYAILQQHRLANKLGLQWLYLGFYVADNAHLNYKSRFSPHQRLIDGQWMDIDPRGP